MTQSEAEKLARHWLELHTNPLAGKLCGCDKCRTANYILSGDMRREIENAAYRNAADSIWKCPVRSAYGDALVEVTDALRAITSLIQPPAQKDKGK